MTKRVDVWERILRKRVIDGDCWLFTGSGNASVSEENWDCNHGKIRVWCEERQRWRLDYVHRISYRRHHGPIPEGLLVRHRCHRRRCFAPDHLTVGTDSDNMQDMMAAGRGKNQFQRKADDEFEPPPF